MANGPLGGFMPTPPSPGQPPQVKLETSAESRGAFNKFLGTLPSNGAIAPIQTGVVASSTAPVSPVTSNVNIFQPQMSQMAPMAPMPMMPPAQPVQMMQFGGEAEESIVGDDPDAGFDFDEDTGSFDVAEQPSVTEDEQQQNIEDSQTFMDTPISTPVVDTRPRTNIRNVGPTSNLRFDPQFAANIAQSRGIDPSVSLRPADFAQTTQGGATAPTLTSGLPSFGTGTDFLRERELDRLRPSNVNQIAPVTTTLGSGVDRRPEALDLLGLGGLGVDLSATDRDRLGFGRARTREAFGVDKNLNPLGITTINQTGKSMSKEESDKIIDSLMSGFDRPKDNRGVRVASLGGFRGGIDRLTNLENQARIADADPLAADVIGAIRSGAAGIPFTNNPGALKQGREDLTTEVVKSLPSGSRLSQDNLAPAIFNTLEAGIGVIDRQLSLYANKPDANITTPAALANTYLGSGNKENSPANRAAYIDAIKAVAGESFDLNNPTTRSNISKAIAKQEFGSAGAQVIDDIRGARTILDDFDLNQLRLNPNITSNVDQLSALDPIARVEPETTAPVSPTTENITATSRGDVPIDPFAIQPTFQNFGLPGVNLPNIGSTRSTVQQDQARALSNLVGQRQLTPGQLLQQNILADRGRALGPVTFGRDLEDFAERVDPAQLSRVGEDFAPALDIVDRREQAQRVQELLNRGARAQQDRDAAAQALGVGTAPNLANLQSATALGGRGISPTTDLTRGPDVSVVGSDVVPSLEVRDIVGDVTQERVADILNRPDRFKDTFKIGDAEFPNLIATLANKAGSFFDRRLFDGIVKKGLDAVVDPDTGRIIGAKDEFGNLIEGRDLEQFKDEGGDSDPIGTFLRKATEDKEEKDTTPNVFGGGTPRKPLENVPTVVSSPFKARDINFRPVGFDAGNLNKLIERITGVPSPRRMQEGGTVAAVDRFLSKVA